MCLFDPENAEWNFSAAEAKSRRQRAAASELSEAQVAAEPRRVFAPYRVAHSLVCRRR